MSQVSSLNEKQQEAIDARNRNILVSAPAGSGKTKILVSRILALLKEGVSIDAFLVLTFTQAAAQEMKQRLVGMLEEEILQADGKLKVHLEKQKAEMPYAFITNFHGFCNQLIDRYGYLVGIKNGYEILSDQEQLLKEALTLTLDKALEDKTFRNFRTIYYPKREDLEEVLLNLYKVFQSLGDKEAFLAKMNDEIYAFLISEKEKDLSEWCFYPELQKVLRDTVTITLASLEDLKYFCMRHGITPFYERPLSQSASAAKKGVPYEVLKQYYTTLLENLQPGKTLKDLNVWAIQKPEASYNIPWKDLDEMTASYKSQFSGKKGALTNQFKDVYEALVDTDVENTMMVHQEALQTIQMLVALLEDLEKTYNQLKIQQNVLDFNDLERYATRLLQSDLPVAKSLNEQLYEIMVDEYQDTNMVQENIVSLIANATVKQVPRFMVGDMKQSIYRFRQADPDIFKEKYDNYPTMPKALRVDLGFNYRSSKVVLDSINFIFNQIMDSHIGSLEYYRDKSAQLNYDFLRKEGAKDTSEYEDVKNRALRRMAQAKDDYTEILLVDSDSDKPQDLEDAEYEAYMIGKRILELKQKGLDGKPLNYSDIAVLMRQTTHFIVYKKVFDRLHIPTTIVLSKGWLNTMEIRQMQNVYKAFMNPYDDMAMYSVLRAPFDFSYFSDEQIAKLKQPQKSLYESLYTDDKYQSFIETFLDLKEQLSHQPFSFWHEYFFTKSGYLKRVLGMKNGMQRYQNLLLLKEKIHLQENSIHDIASWVEYFENLGSSQDVPAVMPKNQEAVVFMTIHKSKGLEFPVVFVAMHDKKFNLQDSKQRLIFDKNLSMAIKPRLQKDLPSSLFNEKMTYQKVVVEYENPFWALLSRIMTKDSISEEMRIYYVALTRASRKLILTGTMSHEQKDRYVAGVLAHQTQQMPEKKDNDGWILNRQLRQASCYLDWLVPSVLRHPDIFKSLDWEELTDLAQYLPYDYAKAMENTRQSRFTLAWYSHEEILDIPQQTIGEVRNHIVEERFKVEDYAYQEDIQAPKSMAVTALSRHDGYGAAATKTLRQTEFDAATIGTLVHEFMEYIPLDSNASIKEFLTTLVDKGRYTFEELTVLESYLPRFEAFRESQCFKMMQEAKQCLKEQPFCCLKDGLLVHGTMDVLCLSQDKVVVIDYKTDRVSVNASDEALIKRHEQQLTLYKEALSNIYPHHQIEAYLYYLEIAKEVKV